MTTARDVDTKRSADDSPSRFDLSERRDRAALVLGGAVLGGGAVATINTWLWCASIPGPVMAVWPLLLLPIVLMIVERWAKRNP